MISNHIFVFTFLQLVLLTDAVGLAPGLYCGLDTFLGIDREFFNKTDLPKIYRKLVRHHHPDRIRDPVFLIKKFLCSFQDLVEEAEKKFRLIATAYETLKDDETREYYDYYLDHPEERYYNYYQYYRMRATPKVDVRLVILVAILLISAFQYLSAHQKYFEALKYAKEHVRYRNQAIEIAKERGTIEFDKLGKIKKKQKNGLNPEDVISGIIEENINISGGYKKHSIYDTLAWQIIILPLILYRYFVWAFIWIKKYWIHKHEYDEEDKLYLIRKNMKMSEDQFFALDEKELDDYLKKELWKKAEFTIWKEQKDVEEKEKQMNSGRYRQYRRFMKKNAGSTISFLDD